MVYVDGMQGIIKHTKTIQWLYVLITKYGNKVCGSGPTPLRFTPFTRAPLDKPPLSRYIQPFRDRKPSKTSGIRDS